MQIWGGACIPWAVWASWAIKRVNCASAPKPLGAMGDAVNVTLGTLLRAETADELLGGVLATRCRRSGSRPARPRAGSCEVAPNVAVEAPESEAGARADISILGCCGPISTPTPEWMSSAADLGDL